MTLAAAPVVERPPGRSPAPTFEPRRRPDGRAALGLVALVVLAAALRLEGIGTWYWIDEALSVGIARHDLVDIPGLLLRDGSPPLWYLLLHGWTAAFGTSVAATHALSLVFALLAVPVAWLVARRLFGERAAWLAATIAAVSPFVTYFAHETRMYSLVVVLGLIVAWSFVETFVDGATRTTRWFVVSLVALLYTHNWGIYTAVACAVALVPVVVVARDRRSVLRRAAIAFGLVAACYLPWVPSLLSQVENTGAPWSYTPSFRDVVRELAALFRDERILVALVLAAGVGLAPLTRRWRSRDALAVLTLGVLSLVPIAIGWGLAHVEPSWATRYLAVVVGPLALVVGLGLARARGLGIAALVIAAVLVIQPITRIDGLSVHHAAKSNARGALLRVAPRLSPGDLVLVVQPEAVPLVAIHLGDDFTYADPMGLVDDPLVMDWRNAEERLRSASYADAVQPLVEALRPGQRLLVVGPGNDARPTDTTWITLFRTSGRRIFQALRADEGLEVVERVRGDGSSYVTVDAILYERVTPAGR